LSSTVSNSELCTCDDLVTISDEQKALVKAVDSSFPKVL